MSQRAEALARRLEQGAEALAAFAESLSDDDWKKPCAPEGRPVGVIVHHVASVYPIEIQLAQALASGKPIEGVTWAAIADMNANHARENGAVTKAAAVAEVRTKSKEAAEAIRRLSDEELDRAEKVSLYGDAPLTAQFFIEDHALRHSYHHLAKLKAALRR